MSTADIAPGRVVPIPHGTCSGYTNHGCRCDPCREARRAYMREYRKNNDYQLRESRARRRALSLLANAHPDEFAELLDKQRQTVGLPPVGASPLGRPSKHREAS